MVIITGKGWQRILILLVLQVSMCGSNCLPSVDPFASSATCYIEKDLIFY